MKKHIDNIIERAIKRLGIFKLLSFGGIENKTLIRLYKIYVRPLFEYGSIAMIHIPQEIKRVQRVQNVFIRTSLQLPSYLNTKLLHEAAGLEMMTKRLICVNKKLLEKMTRSETIHSLISDHNAIVPLNNYKSPLDVLSLAYTQA